MLDFTKTIITQFPSGRWGYVGLVPCALGYIQKDGSEITAKQAEAIRQVGPGLVRDIKTRVFNTQEEAKKELADFQLKLMYDARPL